jgi:predicted ATPase/DNA-binding SARP family transcriptional activator
MAPPRVLSLLAYLIVNRDRRLTRSAVASALWPDDLEEDARANLRRHLHRLNTELPKCGDERWIEATTSTLQWNEKAPAWIDVVEFEHSAESGDGAARAADLFGGEFLEGTFDDWVVAERERLLAIFLDVAYDLAISARGERDFVRACEYADRMLALGEWREDAARVKIAALYEMGDRPGALAAFDAFSKQLRDDMNVDVMPETRALRDAILANVPLSSETSAARSIQAAVPIVGRTEELDRLLAIWQVAARRTGTTVFVGGEAGVGKSRLLSEFAKSVELQGGHALFGHAREGEGAPYQPLVDVIRAGAPYLVRDELPDVWLSALAPLVPELLRLHPDLPDVPSIEGGKQRLHEAFARVLESLARRRPVAVILEDLHWTNVDTLDAFEHLARRVGSSHIMLVATYRSDEASSEHPLRTLRRHLQHEHRATIVGLGPLSRDGIRALVAESAAHVADPEALADAIYKSSDGNPLFAWQLLHGFLETGTLSSENVAIDQAIAERAARLDPETRRVLDVASLVGDRFSIEELAEIGAWDESTVFAAVDTLLDLRLFRYATAPGLDLSFAHRLIRDAIGAEVPEHGLAGLHRRIATVLERTRDAEAALVASHYALAGDRKAAYATYAYAARTAAAIFAHADATEYAKRASEFASDERERFDALIQLLDAFLIGTERSVWEGAVDEAQRLADGLTDDDRFEALLRRVRFLESLATREEQRSFAKQMLELSVATGRPEQRMHALFELGKIDAQQGYLHDAVRAFEAAAEAAPEAEQRPLVRCLALLTFSLLRLGELERGTQVLERAREIARAAADPRMREEMITAELAMALVYEDEPMYRRVGEQHLDLAHKVGSVAGVALSLVALAQSAHMRGEVAEARRRYREARDLQEGHNLHQNFLSNTINYGVLERELGNFAAAIAQWDKALPLAQRLESVTSVACCRINRGEALVALNEFERAIPELEEAVELCRTADEPRLLCDAMVALGNARASTGNADDGIAMMREAIALRTEIKAARSLPNDYCFLIDRLLDAGHIDEAKAAAADLRALYDAAPDRQMFPTYILAMLARTAQATGKKAEAKRLIAEGKRRFDARMAELPDDETRATYAAMSFNRIFAAQVRA